MRYEIVNEGKTLRIIADESERANLRELKQGDNWFDLARAEGEALEHLVCNSELEWVNPADTGDLTDAPMLGIMSGDKILARWAYMDYQVRTFLDDLIDRGSADFIS